MFVHRTVANYILWNVVRSSVDILPDAMFADIILRNPKYVSRSRDSKQYVFFCHCYDCFLGYCKQTEPKRLAHNRDCVSLYWSLTFDHSI